MSSLFSYLDNLYYGSFMGHYFFSGFALEVIIRQSNFPRRPSDALKKHVP